MTICDSPDNRNFGASWSEDETIVFGRPEGVFRVSANGGTPELIVEAEAGEQVYGPQVLPGQEWVLFTTTTVATGPTRWDEAQVVVQSVTSGERRVLWEGGSDASYLPTGHLVYALEDVLYGMAFNVDALEVVGGPVSLIEGITRASGGAGGTTGAANYGVSVGGSLVYLAAGADPRPPRPLVWVDRQGNEELVAAEPRRYSALRLSPDGERAAVVVLGGDGNQDVLIYDLARDIPTRLTFDQASDSFPVWSPDGERVVFASTRGGSRNLFWKAADGTGEAERLTTSEMDQFSSSWSSDGTALVIAEMHPQTGLDITVLAMDDERASATLIETEFTEAFPEISPDGRWMAYNSTESGQFEIYVRPFPNVDAGRWQVSRGGGRKPVWAPDGRELFYRRPNDLAMMVVSLETEPTFRPGNPEVLFEAADFPEVTGPRWFDIAPDGQRFLMTKQGGMTSEDTAPPQINVVQNWFQELTERVPVP